MPREQQRQGSLSLALHLHRLRNHCHRRHCPHLLNIMHLPPPLPQERRRCHRVMLLLSATTRCRCRQQPAIQLFWQARMEVMVRDNGFSRHRHCRETTLIAVCIGYQANLFSKRHPVMEISTLSCPRPGVVAVLVGREDCLLLWILRRRLRQVAVEVATIAFK